MRRLTFLCLRLVQSADLTTSAKFKNTSRCAACQDSRESSQEKKLRMIFIALFDQQIMRSRIFGGNFAVKCPNYNLSNENSSSSSLRLKDPVCCGVFIHPLQILHECLLSFNHSWKPLTPPERAGLRRLGCRCEAPVSRCWTAEHM